MSDNSIRITKRNGDLAPFEEEKLRRALIRSGAKPGDLEEAIQAVHGVLYDGIDTHKIFQTAYKSLKKRSHHSAGRYRLKKAMMELGPSGYPFEKFVGKLLESQGYQATVNVIIQGACVSHEVDVVALKDKVQTMIECKYHTDISIKSDVKVALYIHSRFQDVSKAWAAASNDPEMKYQGMIVTNTRFSVDATQYGECVGLKLVSWDYPRSGSLKDWIDRSGYHPITSLGSLTKPEKIKLLEKGLVLCRDVSTKRDLLEEVGISKNKIPRIIAEAHALSGTL
ncbi:MAG: restriction endonuclease [Bacteroidales bacterium]|nr:restriction endonuclease [Bacteroidales bacterium]